MIISQKNRNFKFIFAILIALVLPLLTISKQQLIIAKEDFIEFVMAMDPGFSYKLNLVDNGEGIFQNFMYQGVLAYRKLIWPSIIKSIPKVIKYKIANVDIERIDINIKFLDYQKILKDRYRALKDSKLKNPTTVSAKLIFRGKTYNSKLRLKGDTKIHWTSTYRMSFRVKLRDKNTILGYNFFSLHKPSGRAHPYDYTFQSMMRALGNLSAVHTFAHIYVNGMDWGIMDVEEHMSKEFLEKLKRKESAIIRFPYEEFWNYTEEVKNPYMMYRISDPSFQKLQLFSSRKYLKNYHYRKVYSYISKKSLKNDMSLYDIDYLAKAYILATAWGSLHTLTNNNTRYYFNPFTLKLEPITTDQLGYVALSSWDAIEYIQLVPQQFIDMKSTQSYVDNLAENLNSVRNVVKDINRHLNGTSLIFPVDKIKDGAVVIDNINKITSDKNKFLHPPYMPPPLEQVLLPTKIQASEFKKHLHVRHYTDGHLEIYNLLPDDVIVKDILYEGVSFLKDKIIVPSYLSAPSPIMLATKYLGIQDNKISVNTEYQGFNRQVKNSITLASDGMENPLLLDVDQHADYLKRLKKGKYEFKKGQWILNEPIVIDGDLNIPSGVRIKFSKNSYLVVKGTLTALGVENEPIILEPLSGSWKGVYVLKGDKRSRLKYVVIQNITSLENGLLKLTGGVTFYKSDVDLENVKIEGVEAEDAINIVESSFTLKSVKISNTASDGLDADFSQGTVSQSKFSNIGGDALDFSGSNIEIDKVEAINVKDKAVSGGENSMISIKNSNFNRIGVGIASKDGSSVFVANTSVFDYRLHAAMSYIKKDFYAMPSIKLVGFKIGQGDPYVRQKGTYMSVNGVEISEMEVNVKNLYQSEAMKK